MLLARSEMGIAAAVQWYRSVLQPETNDHRQRDVAFQKKPYLVDMNSRLLGSFLSFNTQFGARGHAFNKGSVEVRQQARIEEFVKGVSLTGLF